MKGIPAPCTKYDAQQKRINVLDVYKKLSKNETSKLDLTNENTNFESRNNKDYTIPNVQDFTRKCQYSRNESDKFFIN